MALPHKYVIPRFASRSAPLRELFFSDPYTKSGTCRQRRQRRARMSGISPTALARDSGTLDSDVKFRPPCILNPRQIFWLLL